MEKYFVVWFTVNAKNPYHTEEQETIYNEDHFNTRNEAHKLINNTTIDYEEAMVYQVKKYDNRTIYKQVDVFCKV